jgi:exosortase/archaeosortase family protein
LRALTATAPAAETGASVVRRLSRLAVPVALAALYAAGCWPLLPWLWGRWFSTGASGMPAALLLVALVGWGWILSEAAAKEGQAAGVSPAWLCASAWCLVLYAGVYLYVPRLVSAATALFGLGLLMTGCLPRRERKCAGALLALVFLAAPLGPSLQYVFGYPLRLLAGNVAALFLGSGIRPVGTGLTDGARSVFVDGPCSGVRMLTTAVALAATAALCLRLSLRRTALLLLAGAGLAILGNALRAATLFIVETRSFPQWSHVTTGLVVFAGCVLTLVWLALRLRKSQPPRPGPEARAEQARRGRNWATVPFCAALALAASIPLLTPGAGAIEGTVVQLRWPGAWNRRRLVPVQVGRAERLLLARFPGATAQFREDGSGRRVLLRYTVRATRLLHPAEDCYRGMGWKVEPRPALRDAAGRTWSSFRVTRADGSTALVRQCYFAVEPLRSDPPRDLAAWIRAARCWPDASSWYWSAALPGSQVRATLAITVSEEL